MYIKWVNVMLIFIVSILNAFATDIHTHQHTDTEKKSTPKKRWMIIILHCIKQCAPEMQTQTMNKYGCGTA